MHLASRSVVQAAGLISGHSECRFFDETVPVLSHVLALEAIEQRSGRIIMKHPNSGWRLVLHEGGPQAPDKPERNHYGVRVRSNVEVDRAYEYLLARKEDLKLKKVVKRRERAGSYSMFFVEPGGNYWEIESYENRARSGLPAEVAFPWSQALTEEQFPGRGYIPQAFTHGTIECADLDASLKFYTEALGLDAVTHVPTIKPHDIKHPDTPWYVVSLQVPLKNRKYLTPLQRYTLAVQSAAALRQAHGELQARRDEFGITALEQICANDEGESFLLSDLDRNWREIACRR